MLAKNLIPEGETFLCYCVQRDAEQVGQRGGKSKERKPWHGHRYCISEFSGVVLGEITGKGLSISGRRGHWKEQWQ